MADAVKDETAADIHDAAVIKAALAVVGTMFLRRPDRRIADATEILNLVLADIDAQLNGNTVEAAQPVALVSKFGNAIDAAQFLEKRRKEAPGLDRALRQWVEMQSRENTAALYTAALRYFDISPVVPD